MLFPSAIVLTVSELTATIRESLEQVYSDVWVEGEVSNLRIPSSGHAYFTLKDQKAQIRCVLFKGTGQRYRFELEDGLSLILRGRLTVYEPRGEYQIILEYLEPKGVGALHIAFEQLKKRFEAEGLFDVSRKRSLPVFPKRIGLVTSLSGAAIQDMLSVLARRCPVIPVIIYPVRVQGEGAAHDIAEAIRVVNAHGKVDVIIVGRGGGSFEDLWCFNEEEVVRAIVDSHIPVVSAVGHEIDVTLADCAADLRAATPSAAAEAVVPVLSDLIEKIVDGRERLIRGVQGTVTIFRHQVQALRQVIPKYTFLLFQHSQRVDELEYRLRMGIQASHAQRRPRLFSVASRLHMHAPQKHIQRALVLTPQLLTRLNHSMVGLLALHRHRLQNLMGGLDSLSPLSILHRGYSILETHPEGKVIRQIEEVQPGDHLRARISDGEILCAVKKVKPHG